MDSGIVPFKLLWSIHLFYIKYNYKNIKIIYYFILKMNILKNIIILFIIIFTYYLI